MVMTPSWHCVAAKGGGGAAKGGGGGAYTGGALLAYNFTCSPGGTNRTHTRPEGGGWSSRRRWSGDAPSLWLVRSLLCGSVRLRTYVYFFSCFQRGRCCPPLYAYPGITLTCSHDFAALLYNHRWRATLRRDGVPVFSRRLGGALSPDVTQAPASTQCRVRAPPPRDAAQHQ